MKPSASKLPRALAALGASVVSSYALAACTAAGAEPKTQPAVPDTELTITMSEVDGRSGETSSFDLTCDPVGGTLPTAESACGKLTELTDPFAPVPDGTVCLQVISGPGIISVHGTLRGSPVQAQFSQVDSCENDRFQDVLSLLGVDA